MVIIGTLWPELYTGYTTPPALGGPDPRAQEREVLDLAAVVCISPAFSAAEQDRARAAAARDRRLRVALESVGYGLTQTWRPRRSWSPAGKTPRPPNLTGGQCSPQL